MDDAGEDDRQHQHLASTPTSGSEVRATEREAQRRTAAESSSPDTPGPDLDEGTYYQGPVRLRGSLVPGSTTDQRLLDSRGEPGWLHADPWRVLQIQSEFVEGFGALAEVGKAVSVFGSARTSPEDPVYQLGVDVGRLLTEAGYAAMTGGGPGSMEAVNRGCLEAGGHDSGPGAGDDHPTLVRQRGGHVTGLRVERVIGRSARRAEHRHLWHAAIRGEQQECGPHLGQGCAGDFEIEPISVVSYESGRRRQQITSDVAVARERGALDD